VAVAGLDHRRVDLGHTSAVDVFEDGLVARASDDMLEERPDVSVRLDDQDPCHGRILSRPRRYSVICQV
jgi:hypothetical protein